MLPDLWEKVLKQAEVLVLAEVGRPMDETKTQIIHEKDFLGADADKDEVWDLGLEDETKADKSD